MKRKFIKFLEKLSRDEMRIITGGYDVSCVGYGINKCSFDCPCTDHADWCVNGLCTTRS